MKLRSMRTNLFANVKVTRVPIGIWLSSAESGNGEAEGFSSGCSAELLGQDQMHVVALGL